MKSRYSSLITLFVGVVTMFSASLLFAPDAHAAIRYWVGTGNDVDDRWEDTGSWSALPGGAKGATVPGASDTAILSVSGTTVRMRSNVSIAGLVLDSTWTGSLLQGTGSLTIGKAGFTSGSGTFLGGDKAITCSGSLVMTGGIVTLNHSTFSLSGALSVTAGGGTGIPVPSLTSTGTLLLVADAQDITAHPDFATLANLSLSGASTTTLRTYLDIGATSTLKINTGATIVINGFTLGASGSTITNYATITEGTGAIVHTATNVLLADSSYAEDSSFQAGDITYFTVTDSDENIDGTAADTVTITITTPLGENETFTLTETNNISGVFRGSVQTYYVSLNTPDGIKGGSNTIETYAETTLTLTYTDAQDALSNTDTATLTLLSSTSTTTTVTTGSSGGGGGGGGSRRNTVLTSQGFVRRSTVGDVKGEENAALQEESQKKTPVVSPWTDLRTSDQHADSAIRLYDEGIVTGNDDGTVQLGRAISRIEALALLTRALDEEKRPRVDLPFNDVDTSSWYTSPLKIALYIGLVKGFPDGSFRPAEGLNLVQSLKIVSIGLGLASQDDEVISARWYDPYVTAGRQNGLVSGTLDNGRAVTRGEFFSWLVLLLDE
jgi:hypothetical protein